MQIIKDLNGAIEEYIKSLNLNDYSDKANIEQYAREDFKAGVEFAESKFNEMFLEIITENQGLKLYKDNESKRFKKLAIEFGNWIGHKEYSYYNPGSDTVSSWFDKNNHSLDCNTNELFETFIKERNGTNS